MNLFSRICRRRPDDEMPPRPQERHPEAPPRRPRGAWVSEGPFDKDYDPWFDPTGSGPVRESAGGKSGERT